MHKPANPPMPNCSKSCDMSVPPEIDPPRVMVSINIIVSIYAIGSFDPLSNSSSGRRLYLRFTFCDPRMPNTEAESVDDIVAASSSDGRKAKWILVQGIPDSQNMNSPVMSAVISTPTVDSIKPGAMIGFIVLMRVDIPPENRITHNAIIPMNCASCMLLNCIPRPSVPNPIPTSRNTRSSGSPVR